MKYALKIIICISCASMCLGLAKHSWASISIINGLVHEYKINAGDLNRGFIEIENTGTEVEHIQVYKNDFSSNADGQFFYSEPGESERSNAIWLELGTTDIVIEPKEKYKLIYEVRAPSDLKLVGSYWSVLVIESANDINPEKHKNSVNVITKIRYAVQIVCTTVTQSNAKIVFKKTELKNQGDKRYLVVDIENTGELYHRAMVGIELFEAKSGLKAGAYKSYTQSLFPGSSRRFMLDVTDLKPSRYKGVLLSDCANGNIFGLNLELSISDG